MPNPSGTQDRIEQNGHYTSETVLSEEILDLNDSSLDLDRRYSTSKPPASTNDEWSSLTKDLIDSLPRVWTRGLLYFLIVMAGIVLPWAMLSKVDETGSARGRLEPKGATQRLDISATGTVATVKVKEGQTVKAGQVLLELESEVLRTDLQQAQTRLESQQNRLEQLELLKNQLAIAIRVHEQQNQAQELEKISQINQAQQNLDSKQSTYNLQKEEKYSQVKQAQQNLDSKQSAYNFQKLEKLAQVDGARQNLNSSQTAYSLANSRFNKDEAEVQRYQQLWQEGVVPEIKVVEMKTIAEESQRLRSQTQSDIKQAQLRLVEEQSRYQGIMEQAESDIKQAKLRLAEEESRYQSVIEQADSDIKQAQLRLEEQQSSYQSLIHAGKLAVLKSQEELKNLQTQMATLQADISQSQSQIKSLKIQLEQRVMRSPIDGTIFQFPIQRAGVVVQPGQTIAQIAPKNSVLVFKAQMPISESGFLRTGMAVKLKFDAYPFQDYGVVSGSLRSISPDSKILDTPQGKIEVFELEIDVEENYLIQNKRITLNPGQTATAEVIVRQRRVIDFILDPFKKLQKGGLEL